MAVSGNYVMGAEQQWDGQMADHGQGSRQGIGKQGINFHGSRLLGGVEMNYEPNLRMFDFYTVQNQSNAANIPNQELVEKIYRTPEGQGSFALGMAASDGYMGNAIPTFIQALISTPMTWCLVSGGNGKLMHQTKGWGCAIFGMYWTYYQGAKWYAREKGFERDYVRNQVYVNDEVRTARNKQRVREALYEAQYVPMDPVQEFKAKEWQLSKRWN